MKKRPLIAGITSIFLTIFINTASAFEFGLFGDVTYYKNNTAGENAAFSLGALDFYATANISDNTQVFIEYVFEEHADNLAIDLERLWITRTFNDEFSVGLGRFHTPLGNWNRTYHHGAILQDTVSRPFFLEFEEKDSAILPTHIVGALASGSFILSSGELSYEAYIANGPSLDTSLSKPEIDINVASDPNDDKTLGFRIIYSVDEFPLQIGMMYMNNTIAESAADSSGNQGITFGETLIEQTITGIDITANTKLLDILFEYYNLSNDARVGNTEKHSASAYFSQLGYKFNKTNKLIYRYANLNVDVNDDYFIILGIQSADNHVIAYRYDMDDSNSLKFEFNKNNPDSGNSDTTLTLQWAFIIP